MEHNELYLEEDLEKKTRQVQKSLEDGAQAGLSLAAALDKARAAAKALAVTSSQVKRVLSGFDQINRLGEKKKSSGKRKSTNTTEQPPVEQQVTPQLESVDIPSVPAMFFDIIGLYEVMEFIKQVKRELQDLWHNLLVPLGEWVKAVLIPVIEYQLAVAAENLCRAISDAAEWIDQCWQGLLDGAGLVFSGIVRCFTDARDRFLELVNCLLTGSTQMGDSGEELSERVGGVIGVLIAAWSKLKTIWQAAMAGLQAAALSFAAVVSGALQGILDFLQTGFTKGWKSCFLALKEPVIGVINSVIGFLNKLLSGLGAALNAVVNAANKLKITVPDWVPGIGGKTYGFSLKTVSMPQIPYLAQGAVLPANQPFLAVVGDQKHGKNIEAPLTTIQEAVAAVMADHTAGNMAGHEATVAVLRQILEAVLGLDVGEAVIARAAQSYQMKTAVMKGGGF